MISNGSDAERCDSESGRKESEDALRDLLRRYQVIEEGTGAGTWDWDMPNERVHFSSHWKVMRGYSEDEIGDSETEWSGNIHPDDKHRIMDAVQKHFEGRTPFFEEEYRVRCKDGSYIWISDRGTAFRDAVGKVVRMCGSEIDITDRKKAEEKREKLVKALEKALSEIGTLRGILPICSPCKRTRREDEDEKDPASWTPIETYIRERSEAEFSHGICPECLVKHFPDG